MGAVLFFLLLVSAFLASAKAHGRQLRLERELEGHWKVTFGAKNHPWVEKLWARERIFYWSFTLLGAIFLIAASWVLLKKGTPVSLIRFIGLLVFGSMTFGFIATGLMSLSRLLLKLKRVHPSGHKWLKSAAQGSLFWWLLTFVLFFLLAVLA